MSFFQNLQKNPKRSKFFFFAKIGKTHISTLYSFIFLHKNVTFGYWPFFSLFGHGITQLGIVNLQLAMKYTTWDLKKKQTQCSWGCSANTFVINSLTHSMSQWSVSYQSSKPCLSRAVIAREQIFWENVHPLPCVICHVSHVTCHVSGVACHLSQVTCQVLYVKWRSIYFYFTKWWSLSVEGLLSTGLPRLVYPLD